MTVTGAGLSVVVTVTVTVTVACAFPTATFSFTGTPVGANVLSAPTAEEDWTPGVDIAAWGCDVWVGGVVVVVVVVGTEVGSLSVAVTTANNAFGTEKTAAAVAVWDDDDGTGGDVLSGVGERFDSGSEAWTCAAPPAVAASAGDWIDCGGGWVWIVDGVEVGDALADTADSMTGSTP